MADSACLMHAFSYASAIPNEAKQGNPMHALGESISFGRFMSDQSLSWEKWSTFSHNRYVEEAERYARPGSVAQKKAFFEAHYKRIAARKAAALLEQANAEAATETAEREDEGEKSKLQNPVCESYSSETQPLFSNSQLVFDESEVKLQEDKQELMIETAEEQIPVATEPVEEELDKVETSSEGGEHEAVVETETESPLALRKNPFNQFDERQNQETNSGSELSGTPQIEKPLLKGISRSSKENCVSSVTSKKKSVFPSFKSSIQCKTPKIPFSPAKMVTPQHIKKANSFTPSAQSSRLECTDKNKPTPKSLRSLIGFAASKGPEKVPSPVNRKQDNSRVAPTPFRTLKACTSPLRTPKETSSGMPKNSLQTPLSENRRTKRSDDPTASGSKTAGPGWHMLSSVSKSLTACRNKLQSPTLSTPFMLRTEERAARRKQRLEEKFNSKEVQKVQLQTKLKEKAEAEFKKLRQSFCFKARPLPDFYKEREPNNLQHKSGNPGKGNYSSKTQGMISMPPQKAPFTRSNSAKHMRGNPSQAPERLGGASPPKMASHENQSPNLPS